MKGFTQPTARAALVLLSCVACAVASGQEKDAVALPDALGLSTNLVEVTMNLGLVLAAIVILAWIFRRAQGFSQQAAGSLRVTATLPLGPKERILLVQVGAEQIVVGASGAGLQKLHVLTTPLPEAATPAADAESFADKLRRSLGRARS